MPYRIVTELQKKRCKEIKETLGDVAVGANDTGGTFEVLIYHDLIMILSIIHGIQCYFSIAV